MPGIMTGAADKAPNGLPAAEREVTLIALNAQYIHTPAGIYSLAAYAGGEMKVRCLSYSINEDFDRVLQDIYRARTQVMGFSCYIWNIEWVLKLAQALYAMDDKLCILLGGPEVSYDAPALLERYPFLSAVICGEGEKAFSAFVAAFYGGGDFEKIPGLCYRHGEMIRSNASGALLEGREIPIAYDMENLPEAPQILYYESSRGCPYRCAFCLSRDEPLRLRPVEDTLHQLRAFVDGGAKQVKLVDRSFNAPLERAKTIWRALNSWETDCNFHFEVAAAALDEEAIRILQAAPAGRFQLEIGVQSTNPSTQRAIDRVEDFEKIRRTVEALQEKGNIHLHLDLIAGLPGEGMSSFGQSFRDVFALRPDMLQLGFLKLLKGSRLRAVAEDFGCRYSENPPYEVRRTDSMEPEDFFLLKDCERALDLYYHSPYAKRGTLYLLGERDSFGFFCDLGKWIRGMTLHSARRRIESLWDFACEKGWESNALREILLFDFLCLERSPNLPLGFAQPEGKEREKLRLFFQKQGPKRFPLAKGNPWRFCQIQAFDYDLLGYDGAGEPEIRRNYILFDYQRGVQEDVTEEIEG